MEHFLSLLSTDNRIVYACHKDNVVEVKEVSYLLRLIDTGRYIVHLHSKNGKHKWYFRHDVLDGRERSVSADIIGMIWVSDRKICVERRLTDNGMVGGLLLDLITKKKTDISICGKYSGKSYL